MSILRTVGAPMNETPRDISNVSEKIAILAKVFGESSKIVAATSDNTVFILFKKIINDLGFQNVTQFVRGADVLKYCESQVPDLVYVLTDIEDMHWSTLARGLRANRGRKFAPVALALPKITTGSSFSSEFKKQVQILKEYGIAAYFGLTDNPKMVAESILKEMSFGENSQKVAELKNSSQERLQTEIANLFKKNAAVEDAGLMAIFKNEASKPVADQISELKKIVDTDPENYFMKFKIITLLSKSGNVQKAKEYFDSTVNELRNSDELYWLHRLGEIATEAGLFDCARQVLKILSCFSGDQNVDRRNYLTAMIYFKKKKYKEAIEYLEKINVQTLSKAPEMLNLFGISLNKVGEYAKAEKYFLEALNLAPFDFRIMYNLALVYIKLGKKADAEINLVVALNLNPDYDKAKQAIEWLRAKEGSSAGPEVSL